MPESVIRATIRYDDEWEAWRWWVGLIEGPRVTSHAEGLDRTRRKAERRMNKAAARFAGRIAASNRPTETMTYDLAEGRWRDA